MKLTNIFKKILEDYDYRGQHTAPDRNDAPLYDLTKNGIYPDDVYSSNGIRYYGTGEATDRLIFSIIQAFHNKPNATVTIYRAMPNKSADMDAKMKDIRTLIDYVEKFGFAPPTDKKIKMANREYFEKMRDKFTDELNYNRKAYLDFLYSEYNNLKKSPKEKSEINPGDWVTLAKQYAKDHMEGENGWTVVSKKVKASQIFTNGDSWDEWGYDPT